MLDFNNDGFNDIFLYADNKKSFTLHKNLSDSTFSEPIKKFFVYPVDDFKLLNKSSNGDNYYIFISRNKRIVGLANFTKSKSLKLLKVKEFYSYPSKIKIIDLNNDGKNEALIYGNNFDGLSVVKNIKQNLIVTKLIEHVVIKALCLIDLNQDNYKDIILLDMLNNSLKFYENFATDKLNFNREIKFATQVQNMQTANFNDDNFDDIILSKKNNVEILYGDSVYSFSKTKIINKNLNDYNFLISDLNSDKKPEIIYPDKSSNNLTISYSDFLYKDENKYFLNNISAFYLLSDSTNKKLFQLSSSGKIFILSSKITDKNNFNFSIGGKPEIIKIQNKTPKGSVKLWVYNSFDKNINILKTKSLGYFSENKKIRFYNPISNLIIKNQNQIIGFQKKSRLLEIVFNKKLQMKHWFIYSSKPLLKIRFDKKNNFVALEKENGILYKENFYFKKNKFTSGKLHTIDTAVIKAEIKNGNKVFYWKQTEKELRLCKFAQNKTGILLKIPVKDSVSFEPSFIKDENDNVIYATLKTKNNLFAYTLFTKKRNKYKIDIGKFYPRSLNKKDIQFYYDKKKHKANIFYLDRNSNKLLRLTLDKKKKEFKNKTQITIKHAGNFFVDKILGKMYFVYANLENNCLSFREIE